MIVGTKVEEDGYGMDRKQFWALIEAAKAATGGDCRAKTAQLVAALRQGPVEEILEWDRIHDELWVESYRWDLWGAAYLINGGCSDDGFDYFRGWLLGQGQATWEIALADPDSLADHPQVRVHRPRRDFHRPHRDFDSYVYLECEDILGVAYEAYQALTGQEFTPEAPGRHPWPGFPDLGERWDFEEAAQMRTRYPRLWAFCGWYEASPAPP
jgi:Protein of unknown function (DUF4240)